MIDDELAYAREVWAACATLGFDSPQVRRLKAGLDALGPGAARAATADLLALAKEVQQASVAWAVPRLMRCCIAVWPPA